MQLLPNEEMRHLVYMILKLTIISECHIHEFRAAQMRIKWGTRGITKEPVISDVPQQPPSYVLYGFQEQYNGIL